ncbi:MAG: lipid A export permease/ATP-binding protein MsbA [Gammaproteobacteria bacterium]|nr:lipid A export permease/ATP-binding protein MsbA [Gammaproteobacteria bacterium]
MSQVPHSNWQTYRRLMGYARPYWLAFVLAILGNVAYGYLDSAFISAIKPFVDQGLVPRNLDFLLMAPFFIIGIVFLRGLANIVSEYCLAWVGRNVVMVLRQELFAKLMRMPTSYYDHSNSGEELSRLVFNTEQVARATTDAVSSIFKEGAFIVFLIVIMFQQSWRLSLLFMVAAPVIAVVVRFTGARFRKVSRAIQDSMGDITGSAQQALDGHKVVKTYNGFAHEVGRFQKVSNRNRQQGMKLVLTKALSVSSIQFIAALAFALTLYVAAQESIAGRLSAGSFMTLMGAIMALLKPLKQITTVNSILAQGLTAAQSVFDVVDQNTEPDEGREVLERASGALEFEQLSFAYGDNRVLHQVSFSVKPGQKIALVGRSGSGKSTLTNLLLRFYSPCEGRILMDGLPIESLTLASLRQQIALVSQQVTLFNDTVAANIAYGLAEMPDREALIAAARTAHAWEFIERLPQGLDTVIGDNGSLLSGGQRQRLAIARAVLKNAPILVLDEATSALDTDSERHIQAGLDALMAGCTSLIVAHRLSTIEHADQILVIDQGRVVEAGTHAELLARGGEYARLANMQFQDAGAA